jgi:hypothetical protein
VTKKSILLILLGALGLCCLLGGAFVGYKRLQARSEVRSWYRPPTEAPADVSWQVLDPTRVHRVTPDKRTEAVDALKEFPVVELTEAQAAAYVGELLPQVPGARPYLVRSVVKYLPGMYAVTVADGHLVVWHNSLGPWPPAQLTRHPIVLQLDRKPDEVYMDASAAR